MSGAGRALLLAALCVHALHAHCPRLCDCRWKGGKESVLCPAANLTRLPGRLDPGTQLLDLSDNPLGGVPRDAFATAGLLNLQKVYVAKCRLKSLDRYAFRKLINLVELDLSFNFLTTVPSHAFESVPELRELKLSGNPIQRISNDAFSYVPQLVRLELSECRVGTVEPRALGGLEESLEWLKLDGNRLMDVRSSTLTSLQNLHGLELARNPWNCTCGLRPLREWMLRQNVPFGMPPTCRSPPRVAGKEWDRMELDEFACSPKIDPTTLESRAEEGENVTLSCRIGGEPPPKVLWLLRNRVLANTSSSGGRRSYLVGGGGGMASLTLLAAETQDAGTYTCAAENLAGRAEAVVKLAVAKRVGGSGGGHALAAGALVALIALAAILLILAIRAARAKPRRIPPQNGNRSDSYEKIEMNRKFEDRPHVANHTADHQAVGAVSATKKRGDYRHVPSQDTEDEAETYDEEMETPTPTGEARGGAWRAAGGSAASRAPSTIPPAWLPREDTDLHIPRLSEYREPRIDLTPESSSSSGLPGYSVDSQNVANNNIVPDYQNNLPSDDNYPDLLEVNSNTQEALSPLLASRGHSLPGATPLLELRGLPRARLSRAPPSAPVSGLPLTYDYHAAQLERFLEEYRSLQEQLCKMKKTCESIGGSRGRSSSSQPTASRDPGPAPSRDQSPWTTTESLSGRMPTSGDFFRS